jgi:hypothetical protein
MPAEIVIVDEDHLSRQVVPHIDMPPDARQLAVAK